MPGDVVPNQSDVADMPLYHIRNISATGGVTGWPVPTPFPLLAGAVERSDANECKPGVLVPYSAASPVRAAAIRSRLRGM